MKDIHIGRVWGIVNRDEYKEHIVVDVAVYRFIALELSVLNCLKNIFLGNSMSKLWF